MSKADMYSYMSEDKKANVGDCGIIKMIAKYIFGTSDGVMAYHYLRSLRKYEYAINSNTGSFVDRLRLAWYKFKPDEEKRDVSGQNINM